VQINFALVGCTTKNKVIRVFLVPPYFVLFHFVRQTSGRVCSRLTSHNRIFVNRGLKFLSDEFTREIIFYRQQVTVIDDGVPVLSSTTSVVITVEDVNDNAPEMLKKAYRFKIPETQPVQEPLTLENGTAAATAEMVEIDEQLDKKPWTSFGPNDIAGPVLFRVSI